MVHHVGSIVQLLKRIERKDAYTSIHSNRVVEFTRVLLGALRVDGAPAILAAAALHDVGKIELDNETLNCTQRLTPEQIRALRAHPETGHRILASLGTAPDVLAMVLHHHESFDGSGYPHGLRGDAIPLGARIICVVDSFDAMTSDRVYRRAIADEAAFDELRRFAGTQFDPGLVELFIAAYARNPFVAAEASTP